MRGLRSSIDQRNGTRCDRCWRWCSQRPAPQQVDAISNDLAPIDTDLIVGAEQAFSTSGRIDAPLRNQLQPAMLES
jgi:hypothetical protein